MQRWEFLTVVDLNDETLTFSHPQPESVLALFPRSQKESSETRVVIKGESREVKEWHGPRWRRQVADLGWEPVGLSHPFFLFKRPLANG